MKKVATGPWEARVEEYLSFRRKLGFKLRTTGDELRLFARHLERIGYAGPLTFDVASNWALQAKTGAYAAWRLIAIRMFAKHVAAIDPRHEVPLAGALGQAYERREPHIYSADEIGRLLDATEIVKHLPAKTYRTFFGLLAATGLRCGEAIDLRREHVDLAEGRLLVVEGKRANTRMLPLHPTTVAALRKYSDHRDAVFRRGRKSDAFFLSRRGTSLRYPLVNMTFRRLRSRLGLNKKKPLPRLHDLRHTFAVRNLLRWCEAGENVDSKIIGLTTYLGHSNVTCTYWYFSAVPELMAIACRRFEEHARLAGDR